MYTALSQAFPRAILTKSQQEKEDEQEIVECLRGVVWTLGSNGVCRSLRRTDGGSEREAGNVLVYRQLADSPCALGRHGEGCCGAKRAHGKGNGRRNQPDKIPFHRAHQ